ncbi:Putative LOC100571870, partial [Caligus rogercresseyi]
MSLFAKDLTDMMVACDIPLAKAELLKLKAFMHKYCSEEVPSRRILTRHMETETKEILVGIRK